MTEEAEQDWRTAAERESDIAQARALREKEACVLKPICHPVQPEASWRPDSRERSSELASDKLYWVQQIAGTPYPREVLSEPAANGSGLPAGRTSLAEWVLDLVEKGVFTDPGEAVFVILGEHKDLEPHADLREEILRRTLQAAMDDPHPGFTIEEVKERIGKLMSEPRAEPAVWRQREDR